MSYWKTVLLVDDEPTTLNGLRKTLELWAEGQTSKVEILCASSGMEAMKILDTRRVHVLLTDIRMPEMTGLALAQLLEKKEDAPVVLIMSAYSEFKYAQKAIQLGVVNYLLKPISKQELIDSVEKAFEVEANREQSGLIKKVVDQNLLQFEDQDHQTASIIKDAINYVNQNLHEKLTLKEVADAVHLNASYFSVLFKEQTNLTFSDYLTRRRLQVAKHLLFTTDIPINDIAEKVGYQTAKYFIKIFKESVGQTPSQYRKEILKQKNH
ncbi:response regulator transcription factor [Evansella tamaricis]|uniref:Response regulator n=1 Tax=Evansella tamaricis TaxID=2069301 RepID=A0ABS6JL86_9BACI|nr:response regulator [Evansella tamaricis]MBU9714318.1 response regulator [Evansella tamaricis]